MGYADRETHSHIEAQKYTGDEEQKKNITYTHTHTLV